MSQNLSVRDTETLVKNYQESLKPKPATKAKAASFEIADTEKKHVQLLFWNQSRCQGGRQRKGKNHHSIPLRRRLQPNYQINKRVVNKIFFISLLFFF